MHALYWHQRQHDLGALYKKNSFSFGCDSEVAVPFAAGTSYLRLRRPIEALAVAFPRPRASQLLADSFSFLGQFFGPEYIEARFQSVAFATQTLKCVAG